MDITVSQAEGQVPVAIIRPKGMLDGSNYQELIDKAKAVNKDGAQDILVDLEEVPYSSSAGLVALQSIAALLRGDALPDPEAGWSAFRAVERDREMGLQSHFKLLNPQPKVARVLEMVGFTRFLEVHTDLDEAVASF